MACEGYGSIWTEPLNPSTQVFQSRQKRRNISPSQCPQPGEELESRVFPCSSHTGSLSSYSPGSSDTTRSIRDGAEDESTGAVVAIPRSCGYSHLSTLELHYLQYHVEQGSKLLANLETDENPLRALIIPRALLSPLLMKAVCAVSAMHLANRSHDSLNNGTTATNYYIRTLRGLRSTLSEPPSSALRDDTMLAVAFLCKYEIVRGSVKQWAIHLDALQKLVISRGGFSRLDQETAEFLWGLFMYANNVAKITNRREFKAITPAPHNVGITKLDIYIGYTEELIKICARIADLPFQAVDSLMIALEISDM